MILSTLAHHGRKITSTKLYHGSSQPLAGHSSAPADLPPPQPAAAAPASPAAAHAHAAAAATQPPTLPPVGGAAAQASASRPQARLAGLASYNWHVTNLLLLQLQQHYCALRDLL
jgi:hypothetical protein